MVRPYKGWWRNLFWGLRGGMLIHLCSLLCMSPDDKQFEAPPRASERGTVQKIRRLTNQSTMAFELPFTFVGTIVVGGLIGYYLDKWLHTDPWLMVVFGGFGFVAGVVEIGRRLRPGKPSDDDGSA
jgi:F0F1-type ATP synthase assembly protein I